MFTPKKASRQKRPLKIALEGLAGSGKTFTALRLAFDLLAHKIGSRLLVFDTENESASLYADVECDGRRWEFDTVALGREHHSPTGFTEAYRWAVREGYDLIVMDSLSHAWHGALEQVDQIASRSGRNDKFGAWATVTPQYREMMHTLTDPRAHLIATMRVKSEYENFEEHGKRRIRKVGTKADQRENAEYEFDMVMRLEQGNECSVEKVRGCSAMNGKRATKPGPEFWRPLIEWWQGGADFAAPRQSLLIEEFRRLAAEIGARTGRSAEDWLVGLCQHMKIGAETVEMMRDVDLARCVEASRERLKKLQAKAMQENGVA
jgi:hypothetical protein